MGLCAVHLFFAILPAGFIQGSAATTCCADAPQTRPADAGDAFLAVALQSLAELHDALGAVNLAHDQREHILGLFASREQRLLAMVDDLRAGRATAREALDDLTDGNKQLLAEASQWLTRPQKKDWSDRLRALQAPGESDEEARRTFIAAEKAFLLKAHLSEAQNQQIDQLLNKMMDDAQQLKADLLIKSGGHLDSPSGEVQQLVRDQMVKGLQKILTPEQLHTIGMAGPESTVTYTTTRWTTAPADRDPPGTK